MVAHPRLLRSVGQPLGLYLRPGRNDHQVLSGAFTQGGLAVQGVIFDPRHVSRHQELREVCGHQEVEAVLDPMALELATPTGHHNLSDSDVPWVGPGPHVPASLRGAEGASLAASVARFAVDHGFTAVLAPVHFIRTADDPWVGIDGSIVRTLRQQLDSLGGLDVAVYYPLALPGQLLRDPQARVALTRHLAILPIDAVWLRVHPFGTRSSGPNVLEGYINACRDFHHVGLPIVGERTGTVGRALLAFGAVGAIESGVTIGEHFDINRLLGSPRPGRGFSPPPRVYFSEIGLFSKRERASTFFAVRGMKTHFGCQGHPCCRRGAADMIDDPRRHFLYRRSREVARLSEVPEELRTRTYMDEFLRPATDLALIAARTDPSLDAHRRRLEGWRRTLGALEAAGAVQSRSSAPTGHRVAHRHGA